jgi:hypothetical protein
MEIFKNNMKKNIIKKLKRMRKKKKNIIKKLKG